MDMHGHGAILERATDSSQIHLDTPPETKASTSSLVSCPSLLQKGL